MNHTFNFNEDVLNNFKFIQSTNNDSDFEQLRGIHRECMKQNIIDSLGSWDQEFQQARLLKHFKESHASLHFIYKNDELIGTINVRGKLDENNQPYLFIEQFYILPQFQRSGIGTQILNGIETKDKEIKLSVLNKDSKAHNFYEKNGYTEYNEDAYQKYFANNKFVKKLKPKM